MRIDKETPLEPLVDSCAGSNRMWLRIAILAHAMLVIVPRSERWAYSSNSGASRVADRTRFANVNWYPMNVRGLCWLWRLCSSN